jgi:hypothetical protein
MRAGFVDADEVNAEFNAAIRADVGSCQKTLVVALDVGLSPLVHRLALSFATKPSVSRLYLVILFLK